MSRLDFDSVRKQRAVLWERSSRDDYNEPTVSSPVEIGVRWESGQQQTEDSIVNVDATVFVDRKIAIGSIMWLGKLANLPDTKTDLCEVVDYQEVSDFKNRHIQRTVLLRRFNDTLPVVV